MTLHYRSSATHLCNPTTIVDHICNADSRPIFLSQLFSVSYDRIPLAGKETHSTLTCVFWKKKTKQYQFDPLLTRAILFDDLSFLIVEYQVFFHCQIQCIILYEIMTFSSCFWLLLIIKMLLCVIWKHYSWPATTIIFLFLSLMFIFS